MTVAELGIKIDTGDARRASADLDKFASSARGAEVATAKVTSNVIPFRQAVDAVGASSRNSAMMMRNLSFQVNDIATGLASGQSPFQILAQQGGQVYQALQMGPGGVGGSLQAIKAQLLSLITPARLAVAGIAAIGVAGAVAFQAWKSATLGVDDAAKAAGIAQQEFSKLQAAASFKGIDAGDFQGAMKTFAKNVDDARFSTGELFKLFDANKVAIGDTTNAFSQFAELIKGAQTDTQALYYLQQAGLPPTMEWVRLLQGGADSLEQAKQAASAFAANSEMIQKAREFDEAWNQAWTNFKASSLSAIQSALSGLSSLSDAATGLLAKIPGLGGEGGIGSNLLKSGQGTPLSQDVGSMYGGLFSSTPLKITVDPRSIETVKEAKTAVDGLAESLRRMSEQRATQLEKAKRETSELLSFAGASREAALAQAELAKYRERNIAVTPQLEAEIRAWAQQVAKVKELNDTIKTLRNTALDFANDFVDGLMQGKNVMDSLGSSAKQLSSSLMQGAFSQLAQGNLITAGLMAGGSVIANIFGNNQQKKQQQQQAMQQQLQAQQDAARQAAQQAQQLAEQQAEQARQAAEERLRAEKELADRLAAFRKASADREFAALNETESLAGRLAEHDRKARQEREDAQRDFGQVTVELERAQAAERNRIVKDSLQTQLDYYKGLRTTISDFLRGLNTGNLSTLSPAEQFMSARNDFQNQLALAQGGDRTAQGGITNVAQQLLEQGRAFLGPSAAFGELKDRVTQQLSSLTDIAMSNDSQMQELQRMGAYTGQLVQLQSANNESAEEIIAELNKLRLDLRQGLEAINLRAA